MLRHACGYKLANDGHDARSLQAYIAHRNIQHTTRYAEMSVTRGSRISGAPTCAERPPQNRLLWGTMANRGLSLFTHSMSLQERARGALMATETHYAPIHIPCPKCGKPMRLLAIEPAPSVQRGDEITYRWGACNHEERRLRTADKP
jgi:hypothetical protein